MKLLQLLPFALSGLLLTSCDGQREPTNIPDSTATQNDGSARTAQSDPLPDIPVRFQGTWDGADGTCAPESDLRIAITDKDVLFYEAMGTVTAVTDDGSTTILTLQMEGEGDQWNENLVLSLRDDGQSLTAYFQSLDKQQNGETFARKKCPS